jgi:uncharacterized protein (DUF427 family)
VARIRPEKPGPGQESVWDYPRPPRLERSARTVEVRSGGTLVARSTRAWRVLETSHPPVWYVPAQDVTPGVLTPTDRTSYCEFKGVAAYWTVLGTLVDAAWSYPHPARGYEAMADAVAFYPGRLDCTVDGEAVRPQAGGFYGGWITDEVVGPFKGGPTSLWW